LNSYVLFGQHRNHATLKIGVIDTVIADAGGAERECRDLDVAARF